MSSLFKGSEGKGGNGGNKPEGGGNPVPLVLKGNLGRVGRPPGEGDPRGEFKSWAAAAETGGRPGRLGNLNPGGKMGVIPAMGLLIKGAIGSPFFSASSINCNSGG